MSTRDLDFTPEEMTRLRAASMALGTSMAELIHDAAMQGCDEALSGSGDARKAHLGKLLDIVGGSYNSVSVRLRALTELREMLL